MVFGINLSQTGEYVHLPSLGSINNALNDTFSPGRILAQIVLLQTFYYFTAIILFSVMATLSGMKFTLDWLFSWEPVTIDNTLGLSLMAMWGTVALISVAFITIVVGRSKLAWDFAVTVHLFNLIFCWFYTGRFPTNLWWWFLQIASCLLMVGLGTYTTRWRELRDTFFEGLVDPEMGNSKSSDVHNPAPTESIALQEISK